MTSDAYTLLELLFFSGLFTAFAEVIKSRLNRKRRVTNDADKVKDMALDLIKPLHEELKRANEQVDSLRIKVAHMESDLQMVGAWAVAARMLLDASGIKYPEPPELIRKAA